MFKFFDYDLNPGEIQKIKNSTFVDVLYAIRKNKSCVREIYFTADNLDDLTLVTDALEKNDYITHAHLFFKYPYELPAFMQNQLYDISQRLAKVTQRNIENIFAVKAIAAATN